MKKKSYGAGAPVSANITKIQSVQPRLFFGFELLAACSVFLGALLVYFATLYPTCPGGDSGELIAAAHTLGIAHPPGYPLYTLLGKLFSLVPAHTIAWRLNLMSAFFDAFAAGVLCLTVTRWRNHVWAGVLAGGMFAFAPLTWTYAVAAEVFALNNFFIAILLLLCVLYVRSAEMRSADSYGRRKRIILFAAFWVGLGLSNHHAFVIYSGPVMLWLLWHERRELLNLRGLTRLAGLFTLGLLPYVYLPIAASRSPAVAWGDLTTFDGFLTHVLRREYGTFRMSSTSEFGDNIRFFEHVFWYLGHVFQECFLIGIPLAIAGVVTTVKRTSIRFGVSAERNFAWLLLLIFILYLMIFCGLSNLPMHPPLNLTVQARFWQQSNFLVYLWIGLGFSVALRRFGSFSRAAPVLCVGLILSLVVFHFKAQDQSGNWTFRDFSHASLEPLPERAILLADEDCEMSALLYFHSCERLRPDVILVREPLLTYPWARHTLGPSLQGLVFPGDQLISGGTPEPGQYTLKALLDANVPSHQVFTVSVERDQKSLNGYRLWPAGMNMLILPKSQEPNLDHMVNDIEFGFGLFDQAKAARYGEETWERVPFMGYWAARYFYGFRLLAYAIRHGDDNQDTLKSVVHTLEDVAAVGFMDTPDLYKNLGTAYQGLSRYDAMAVQGMARAWTRFLQLAAPDDPDVPKIRAALGAQQENNPAR